MNQEKKAGSRKGYYTKDDIHVINQVIEKSADYNQLLHRVFVHPEKKTFDSVEIPAVIKALRNKGVKEAYLVLHKKSRKLPIKKGVRQGATISPALFTACLEEVFRTLYWEGL